MSRKTYALEFSFSKIARLQSKAYYRTKKNKNIKTFVINICECSEIVGNLHGQSPILRSFY